LAIAAKVGHDNNSTVVLGNNYYMTYYHHSLSHLIRVLWKLLITIIRFLIISMSPGDRLYQVTIQRIFDKLKLVEKILLVFLFIWETITTSVNRLKDYIRKTENDISFIQKEMKRFRKFLPSFANVVIDERDEYISQSLYEIGGLN
jgi:pheromone shutdown protein TraB